MPMLYTRGNESERNNEILPEFVVALPHGCLVILTLALSIKDSYIATIFVLVSSKPGWRW